MRGRTLPRGTGPSADRPPSHTCAVSSSVSPACSGLCHPISQTADGTGKRPGSRLGAFGCEPRVRSQHHVGPPAPPPAPGRECRRNGRHASQIQVLPLGDRTELALWVPPAPRGRLCMGRLPGLDGHTEVIQSAKDPGPREAKPPLQATQHGRGQAWPPLSTPAAVDSGCDFLLLPPGTSSSGGGSETREPLK